MFTFCDYYAHSNVYLLYTFSISDYFMHSTVNYSAPDSN